MSKSTVQYLRTVGRMRDRFLFFLYLPNCMAAKDKRDGLASHHYRKYQARRRERVGKFIGQFGKERKAPPLQGPF